MADADAVDLEYPADSWGGFFRDHFGPSMLWALIGIGGSHIVIAPKMAGTFGLFALWAFALVYAAKYGAWELGIRYNYGAGGNPVEAYDQLPGPANWMQWFTIVVFTVFYIAIVGAVGMSTAALVVPITGGALTVPQAFVVFVGGAGVLVYLSRYGLLETILVGFTVALGLLLVLGAAVGPPPADVASSTGFAVPDLSSPAFIGLFAAAAGFAPTGFSTSVLIGSWSMAKGEGATQLREHGLDPEDEQYHEYIAAWIETGRRDFNIGYAFSFVLVAAMILLATNVLYPEPPGDENFALAVGSVLQESFGAWSYWAMTVGAFAALYSTVITLLDGASRATGDVVPMALDREGELDSERIRKAVVAAMTVVASAIVLALGNIPVTFVLFIAAVLAVTELLFYPANWYVVRENLPERFQPSRRWVAYYVVSLVLVTLFGVLGAIIRLNPIFNIL